MAVTILILIVVLSILVFVHEFGHFITARIFGAKVEEFGFGLPPRIFGLARFQGWRLKKTGQKKEIELVAVWKKFQDGRQAVQKIITEKVSEIEKIIPFKSWRWFWGRTAGYSESGKISESGADSAETREQIVQERPTIYSLNWIPIGGFVKIKGEDGQAKTESDSFASRPIWQRAVILTAGVAMNVVLAAVLLTIGFGSGIPAVLDETTAKLAVSPPEVQVVEVISETSADQADFRPGDVILKVDDRKVSGWDDFHDYLVSRQGREVAVAVRRHDRDLIKTVEVIEYQGVVGIGVSLVETAIVRYPWHLAIWQGIKMTFIWLATIVVALAVLVKNLITGAPAGIEVAGPVGIAVLTGQMARLGFGYLLQFTAILSLNLAILNILPFPALDGGRLFFLGIEKIRGRALKSKWENLANNIGFILLMALIAVVTFQDILKYGSGFLDNLKSWF